MWWTEVINNNDNNYSYRILCFQRTLQPAHYVIFNLHRGPCALSVVLVCLNVFVERETLEEQRGGLKFSSSWSAAVWKVRMDNGLETRMRWEVGEERSGWQWSSRRAGWQMAMPEAWGTEAGVFEKLNWRNTWPRIRRLGFPPQGPLCQGPGAPVEFLWSPVFTQLVLNTWSRLLKGRRALCGS